MLRGYIIGDGRFREYILPREEKVASYIEKRDLKNENNRF